MTLFADYLQPLTNWLQANPNWALFITFIVALTESLAIIGSIIPGSVTMTAIGILAGSGIMRIDLTLLAAILGATAGDSLSYAIGYYYSDRIVYIWPFKKYPNWLAYGKDFFGRHGGKSVLLGRFVGPLRSLIPIIAGIMHMKQWRFLLSNILSAIGWSFLYVMPGVLIGAASHGLSAESATRLFLLILIALAGIWFIGIIIKWLFIRLNTYLKINLHKSWLAFKTKPILNTIYKSLTPKKEANHYPTAGLFIVTVFFFVCFSLLAFFSINPEWLNFINYPVFLFMQSFHTPQLEAFFIVCMQLASTITILSLYVICCLWFIYHKHIKAINYITCLLILSNFLGLILSYLIDNPRPQGLQVTMPGSSFPALNIQIATAFYGFLLFYINNKYALVTNSLRSFILVALGLSGLGAIYLGDVWLTDVLAAYCAGATLCLAHYLIYRKANLNFLKVNKSSTILFSLFLGLFCAIAVSTYVNFKTLAYNHTPYQKEYTLKESEWWNQQKPILPLYRLNRIGKKISLLNIQYAGDLDALQNSLEEYGWQTHSESFTTKLLLRISSKANDAKFPLLAQLYNNKPPELIMTYIEPKSKLILELEIWQSNYNIPELHKSLWIGTIHQNPSMANKKEGGRLSNTISYIMPSLNNFTLRRIELPKEMIKAVLFPTTPTILLIKSDKRE